MSVLEICNAVDFEKSRIKDNNLLRPTIDKQLIEQLELNGNSSDDWAQVLFHQDALSNDTFKKIKRCTFTTNSNSFIVINSLSGSISVNGIHMMCVLQDTNFIGDCFLSKNCLIISTAMISNVFIGESCAIVGCGIVQGPLSNQRTAFGNGNTISVGPENGGRDIVVDINLPFYEICQKVYKFKHQLVDNALKSPATVLSNPTVSSSLTIICSKSVLLHCSSIVECFIGESSFIQSSSLSYSTLLSAPAAESTIKGIRVTNGVQLSYGLIHTGCQLENNCQVEHVYMSEYSSIGVNARVCQSILAPDASVAGGECHHSVVGPFIGFHHHSLLIAAIWPLGRGNIAYGAKVGEFFSVVLVVIG